LQRGFKLEWITSALLGTNTFFLAALTTTFLGFIDSPALPMAIVIAGCGICSTLLNFLTLGPRLETAPTSGVVCCLTVVVSYDNMNTREVVSY